MNWDALMLAVAAALIVAAYALVSRGLLLLTDPVRRRACQLARQIAARGDVSSEAKDATEAGVQWLTKGYMAWAFALVVTPVSLFAIATSYKKNSKFKAEFEGEGGRLRQEYSAALLVSVLANSPIAFILFFLQIIPLVGLFGSSMLAGIMIGRIESMIETIDNVQHHLLGMR